MLRLRPFRKNDAKTIITWTNKKEEFYKWSAGILGEYPVTENRLLEATSGREDNDRYFPFTAFDESGIVGFLQREYVMKKMIKNSVSVMLLSIL